MRVLAVDVGTGTQDILLYDTDATLENSVKLVMPAPTVIAARAIRRATAARRPVLFAGVMMGGGPCHWAASDHIAAGLPFYATPAAARTFDDDLTNVEAQGVHLVGDDEAACMTGVERVRARDLQYDLILETLHRFGVEGEPDAVCVAVFDHGNAPPGVSDRVFRFNYLRDHLHSLADLHGFAHARDAIPARFTRFQAVADDFDSPQPLFLMDTAAAAIVGALEDPAVARQRNALLINIGNFHCLAFHVVEDAIAGLFEHHTGELTAAELEVYLTRLGQGVITFEEVYADSGHGALIHMSSAPPPAFAAVTGPRRAMLTGSALAPYPAVPHGDMMLAGCFGLLRAAATRLNLDFGAA